MPSAGRECSIHASLSFSHDQLGVGNILHFNTTYMLKIYGLNCELGLVCHGNSHALDQHHGERMFLLLDSDCDNFRSVVAILDDFLNIGNASL